MTRYGHGPRRPQPAPPSQSLFLLRGIMCDPRFAGLGAPAQSILLAAVLQHGDRRGMFFAKARNLATLVGRSDRSVRSALKEAVASGLLIEEPYMRPNHTRGSNTYRVDETLVISAEETFQAYADRKKPSERQEWKKPSERQARKKPSEQDVVLNEPIDALGQQLREDKKAGFRLCADPQCQHARRTGSSFCEEHGKEADRVLRVVLKPVVSDEEAA